MTIDNCAALLKAYKHNIENAETDHAKEQSQKNYDMMKNHILTGKKFIDSAIRNELEGSKPSQPKKEVKDAKKSKG